MKTIQALDYKIYFNDSDQQALNDHLEKNEYSMIFILVDENSNEHCLPILLPNLVTNLEIEIIEIESQEAHKNIETCTHIWDALIALGADRKALIINLGGGVISDIGGFVAATYKRGIAFINIPTTLLAMVDAAIGGKNGVDLNNLKNQIGTITAPEMVVIDTQFLETLPKNQMKSGLAEMLKHGLIFDKNYWQKFGDLAKFNFDDLELLIYESVEIKNKIVSQDLSENGVRKSLNFGHTLGHAIESYFNDDETKTSLLHGEAVAVGMILESHLSFQKNLISETEYQEIKTRINSFFTHITFNEKDILAIQNLLIHDKKNEYGKIQFVLLNKIGEVKIDEIAENEMIFNAFKDYSLT